MDKTLQKLFKKYQRNKKCNDVHIIRGYGSYAVISNRKVVEITKPYISYCPLAYYLYKDIRDSKDYRALQNALKKSIQDKIKQFGFFSENRELIRKDIAIPYGASEILMYALQKKCIDAAVVACDGAGTVVVNNPLIVQGIGARMHGLFYTTPIHSVIENLERNGCSVIDYRAVIDQIAGIKLAARFGYKTIAVTINASMENDLSQIKMLEKELGVSIISFVICTTGISRKKAFEIQKYADVVWSCASPDVREIVGKKSLMQLSLKIPVFVLTQKGLEMARAYSAQNKIFKKLNSRKQYIIAQHGKGVKITMGNFIARLHEAKLPIRSNREPIIQPMSSRTMRRA